mmetsp:Transcript_56724/g.159221  ORF Transcript_56724/g.159221 Transcript_56724/m.159221 type:complete len:366 (+) Transcript_56724:116-1213(+)
MKLFRKRGAAPGDATLSKPMRFEDLDAAMRDVAAGIEPWDESRAVLVRPLQQAVRNHGHVQLMEDSAGGKMMAVKRMPSRWVQSGPKEFEEHYPAASEKPWHDLGFLHRLQAIHFPYVCDLYGVFRSQDETLVATSFCQEGDLSAWCDSDGVPAPGPAREAHMMPLVAQIFSAVRWLHNLGIAHRDISLENILLAGPSEGARVKIIDFGLATLTRTFSSELSVKASYRPPEMHLGVEVDAFLVDVFAAGVVTFAMAAQDYPWLCTKPGNCQLFDCVRESGLQAFLNKRRLRRGNGEHLSEVFSPALVEVLQALLDFQPERRGCVGELAFQDDVQGGLRSSVWDLAYLSGAAAGLPDAEGRLGASL